MKNKKTWNCEIEGTPSFSYIRISRLGPITPDYPEIATILVAAAKLMVSSIIRSKVNYHSFELTRDCLTIIIEDHTKYHLQNASKIAKHLEHVWQVLMSRYGCACGLKY